MGFSDRKTYNFRLTTNATDGQALEANWRDRRRFFLIRLMATNESTTISLVKIYDKSTTAGAPTIRGDSASAPLLEFYVPANSTVTFEENRLPKEFFIGGMTVNATQTPLQLNFEIMDD